MPEKKGKRVPEKPSSDEIMEAIHQSGYLMEQTVATKLEDLGYFVETNVPFEDPDEGKSREIDIRGIQRFLHDENQKISAFVELIVECKNSVNPFVFISRSKGERDSRLNPVQFIFPFSYKKQKQVDEKSVYLSDVSAYFHLGYDKVHYNNALSSKAVQFCRIDRKGGGWHANHGGLYDAIFYPLAKAVTARKSEISRFGGGWNNFWFLLPVVVTSADLLEINSASANPSPEPRNHIGFTRELKSGKVRGLYMIDFVRHDRLALFVEECVEPIKRLTTDLVFNRSDFLMERKLTWLTDD